MQYQIGPLTIRHRPFSAGQIGRTTKAGLAVKPVLGARQPGEWVGPGEDTLTLRGTLFPRHQGGKGEIALAHAMVTGDPIYVLRGDLVPLGWWQVTDVDETGTLIDDDGVGQRVEVTIKMRRAARPSPIALVAQLIGLFT